MFEFYVMNYDFNRRKVEMFNIFNNWKLDEAVQKEVKKYIRSPKNYKHTFFSTQETITGWEGFKKEILGLIQWQEWGRYEYEISVSKPFEDNLDNLEKWDCYMQCVPNIETICHTVIRQYKEVVKEKNNEK